MNLLLYSPLKKNVSVSLGMKMVLTAKPNSTEQAAPADQ